MSRALGFRSIHVSSRPSTSTISCAAATFLPAMTTYYGSTGGYPNNPEDYISVPHPDLGNRARRAQQPFEPSDIDRDEIVAMPLVTR